MPGPGRYRRRRADSPNANSLYAHGHALVKCYHS
jgi:hypothetical protein